MINLYDIKFMNLAINLAKKNIGITGKNPSIGCVITYNNVIIATGITQENGRPHAEINAIDKIKDKSILKESTLYVTLEPCISNKKNNCCDYIIKHQVKRVVIAMPDPNIAINNKSISRLRANNIEVLTDLMHNQATSINQSFCFSQKNLRPFITLKLATSIDGKIATKIYDSKWISNEKSRHYAHYLRSINDAILIGANTLKYDNPQLNCRLNGLEKYSPKIIIMGNNIANCNLLNLAKNETYIISSKENKSNNFIKNDKDFLKELFKIGIKSILVEGGGKIATHFLINNYIDKIIIARSNKIIGNDGIASFGELNYNNISQINHNFQLTNLKEINGNIIETYINANNDSN